MMPSFDSAPVLKAHQKPEELRNVVLAAARMLDLRLDPVDLPAILEHQQMMLRFAQLVADGEGDEPAPVFHP